MRSHYLGLAALAALGCEGINMDPCTPWHVTCPKQESQETKSREECDISFSHYMGMCKTKAFDGSTILIKEYSDGRFVFFRDKYGDDCFDTKGEGFYMLGLSRRTEERELPKGEYCLER